MGLLRLLFITALLTLPNGAIAQSGPQSDPLPDLLDSEPELVTSKKLKKRGEHIDGPISATHPAGLLLASFDQNADYTITPSEITAGQTAAFQAADRSQNGSLNFLELEAWREKALGSLDAMPGNISFDRNFDQTVSREEFDQTFERIIRKADKNGDGALAFSELIHVFAMPKRIEAPPPPPRTFRDAPGRGQDRGRFPNRR